MSYVNYRLIIKNVNTMKHLMLHEKFWFWS